MQQPPPLQSVLNFNKAYYSASPPDTLCYKHNTNNFSPIVRNTPQVKTQTLHRKFIVDSGTNRHMCNYRDLFINISPYNGPKLYVTLGDDKQNVQLKALV